jgi:DNA-binding NarL/FixJ family response regulator
MRRILIADDNELVRKSLKEMLSEGSKWLVCGEASDGDEAIGMVSELKPDLVILDFKMPRVDGLRAAAQILKLMPAVPIVLYTLHKSAQIEQAARAAGIHRVVSKYESADHLVESVEELLSPPKGSILADTPAVAGAADLHPRSAAKKSKRGPKRTGAS